MSYFGFLLLFLGIPITILFGLTWLDKRQGNPLPSQFSSYAGGLVLLAHVIIAFVYTTPWDNYLVATNVWWYDENLVTGIVFGWVPIEEYTFFIVQTVMTGLWVLWLMRRGVGGANGRYQPHSTLPQTSLWVLFPVWLLMVGILVVQWQSGTYLALQLAWALIPIMIQTGFGAHILWQYRRLVAWGIVPTTLYLATADAIAILGGIWTIDPEQSLYWLIGGVLPIEEFLFFLITNTLVVFGMTLVLAQESQTRLAELLEKLPVPMRQRLAVSQPRK